MIRTTRRRRLPLTALALALVAGTALAGAVPAQAADAAASSRTPGASTPAAAAIPAPIFSSGENLGKGPEPTIRGIIRLGPGTPDTTGLDYEYQLDGAPWKELTSAVDFDIEYDVPAPAGDHTLAFRVAGVWDGVPVVGAASSTRTVRSFGVALAYTPEVVVDGPRITVSWDLRAALNGTPDPAVYYIVGGEFVDVDAVDSVTFEPGYDASVDFTLTYGPNSDAARSFTRVYYTGSAPGGAALTSVPTPAIVGRPIVGTTLSVRTGLWQPAPVTLSYQWYSDGTQIPGASGPTHTVSGYDARTRITVEVRGTRDGYRAQTRMSAPTPRVPVPVVTAGRPTIRGKAVVGGTLIANPGSWKPAFLELTYEWFRDGERIDGATGTTYQPTAADRGHDITVLVYSDDAYYSGTTAISAARRVS
ncbi:hypothetical protein ITJ44_07190 [Clavibacter sp. VKM Ac-2873]|uniref:hypothetical protein n=1 Tax=Clavibacter sp. VKM Ac-2873 TaxID=2783813 RepID=UPI00188A6A0C|nr:hypothetical protein [Clavibacter sp. VKM Ac-2873]MBF4617857.1 hypothetical protein [Clavibacter sp. VKM Ac-2873]